MKHQVFRKMSQLALLGHIVTPVITVIPVQVGPSFPQSDIYNPSSTMLEEARAFHKRNHRSQTKEGYTKSNRVSTTPHCQDSIRTKDDIIYANQVICTRRLHAQAIKRENHIFELIMQEAIVYDYICSFYTEMSESEYNELRSLHKKLQNQCVDAIDSYYQFILNNIEVFIFGRLTPDVNVPDDMILYSREFASTESQDKHLSSRNKKEKFSRYKRRARKNKAVERDFFMQDWIDDYEDTDFITLADVEANAAKESERSPEMSTAEKAYLDFVTAPCVEDAAWAIHNGTEYEHAQALADAYQLLSNYQKAVKEDQED